MDRCRVTSNFNGVPPQIGIPNFFPTAPSQISLPPKLLLADSQLFSYMRPTSAKLAGDRLPPTADETEISIFDADRYFNGSHDSNSSSKKLTVILNEAAEQQRGSSVDGFPRSFRPPSFRATPTASSEASWNSQTGLLTKQRDGNLSVSVPSVPSGEQKKEHSSSGRYFFGYRCPCAGKKSVDVEERESETKSSSPSHAVKKNSSVTKTPRFPEIPSQDPGIFRRPFSVDRPFPAEEPGRVSLEVFRPPPETLTPARNFAGVFKIPASPNLHPAADDDVASDASSDLFEIESLSTQIGFRRRDSLDELASRNIAGGGAALTLLHRGLEDEEAAATASIAPSECYPPSEVSVDWSVTTAEGYDRSGVANFSSAVSEYEELRYAAGSLGGWKKKGIGGGGGGGLLSCRSEKAVNIIGPQPVWFEPETQRRVGKSSFGLDRVVGVARLGGGNPAHGGSVAVEPAKPDQVLRRVGLLR